MIQTGQNDQNEERLEKSGFILCRLLLVQNKMEGGDDDSIDQQQQEEELNLLHDAHQPPARGKDADCRLPQDQSKRRKVHLSQSAADARRRCVAERNLAAGARRGPKERASQQSIDQARDQPGKRQHDACGDNLALYRRSLYDGNDTFQ